MGGSHHAYEGDGIPLNATTRTVVIMVHYCAFLSTTFAVYALMRNLRVVEQRICSPFLVMITLTWLMIASAFEIGNHFYVDNWQLYDPQADLINGSFSFFNFGAQNLLALSVRKQGTAVCRKGQSILDWIAIFVDPILCLLILVNPVVYATAGRSASVSALSPLAAVSGIFTMFRVWINLGPNLYTKLGGIFFFVFAMCGVSMFAVYNSTKAEWVHALIGGFFVTSVVPLAIAFLYAEVGASDSNEEEAKQLNGDVEEGEANDEIEDDDESRASKAP